VKGNRFMKIIGEKINGTRKHVGQAIKDRNADFIRTLAKDQVEAGADYLDVNAGTSHDREGDDLVWLVETIQSVLDTPLCLDSANPQALTVAIKATNKTPMINSISGEPNRLEHIVPIAAENNCPVIALAMDDKKIPESSAVRVSIIQELLEATRQAGIPDKHMYIDPLVMALSTNTQSGEVFFDTIRTIRKDAPETHFTAGLSNISFGLPARSYINRAFLTLAIAAGLDSAVLDPMDKELMRALLAAQLVLGHDRFCRNYITAYRAGEFSTQ
jgi:5-methyltetrahydrofolate--homocysteine methyltransferase